jgi:hypothetical protein
MYSYGAKNVEILKYFFQIAVSTASYLCLGENSVVEYSYGSVNYTTL